MAGQEWLLRRLNGLRPFHFEEGSSFSTTSGVCLIGCSRELEAPRAFRRVWSNFEGGAALTMTSQQLSAATALLIFSNPFLPDQVQATSELVTAIDAFGANAPPMFWVPHTVAPEARPPNQSIGSLDDELIRLLEMGLDGIIADEPEGMKLALQVRMKIQKSDCMSQTLNGIINARRARAVQGGNLKDQIHSIFWDYLCVRMAPSIPPCNHNLPPNLPTEVGGLRVATLLGRGAFGSVYALEAADSPGEIRQVAKIVDTARNSKVRAIRRLKNMVDVMLLVSTAEWHHPNVARLHEIYHSRTHLIFRMEYAGSESLFQRLQSRDGITSGEEPPRPLQLWKASALINQLLSVVTHLHTGPGVCLRDLKPESLGLLEAPEAVTLKILDLDLAITLGRQVACRTSCGTIPFAAPEVLTEREYNGRSADCWSMGVILLELLCCTRVLETSLELSTRSLVPDAHAGRQLAEAMSVPGRVEGMLRERGCQELRHLAQAVGPAVCGLLTVNAEQRWRAEQARDFAMGSSQGQ